MSSTALDRFLALSCDEIERRAQISIDRREPLLAGAAEFRRALSNSQPRDHDPPTVPVARHLGDVTPSSNATAEICTAVRASAPELPWIPSPRLDDGGVSAGLAPINDVRDLGQLVCGLMLLAPGAAYPEHAHPPNEIYLPIAGDGQWRYGGSAEYVAVEPDALVYNRPRDRHGAIASNQPLLALYVLWG